jgi:CheY-like chemotaxis protein
MQSAKRLILCAESHADTCSMLNHMLSQMNYEIWSAKDIAEALDLARVENFDLYLLSDRYADGTAVDLCRQLRQHDQRTPILFYSTYARETDRLCGLQSGAQAYLVKPGNISELKEAVIRLIEQPKGDGLAAEEADVHPAVPVESERRRYPRIYDSFPAVVYGADSDGKELEMKTVLDNFSAEGFFMRLPGSIKEGAKLSLVICTSPNSAHAAPPVYVAVNGRVIRTEPQKGGGSGLGMMLHGINFFEAWSWALR